VLNQAPKAAEGGAPNLSARTQPKLDASIAYKIDFSRPKLDVLRHFLLGGALYLAHPLELKHNIYITYAPLILFFLE
jgi:hypothetical protein